MSESAGACGTGRVAHMNMCRCDIAVAYGICVAGAGLLVYA